MLCMIFINKMLDLIIYTLNQAKEVTQIKVITEYNDVFAIIVPFVLYPTLINNKHNYSLTLRTFKYFTLHYLCFKPSCL